MKKWIVMLLLAILLFGSVIGFNIMKQRGIAQYMANMPEPEFPVTVLETQTANWIPAMNIEPANFREFFSRIR